MCGSHWNAGHTLLERHSWKTNKTQLELFKCWEQENVHFQ
ncbi:rCG58328 [Rattus norvegicus]|uniref:RCG58328 n=1 Tax=Rattus norvegicus TaxID=10116 RepID=A6J4K9_RAT|nr:rCG58328 [Rattus norvegicus]